MSIFAPPPALSFTATQLQAIERFLPYNPQQALENASALRAQGFTPPEVSAILNQAKLRTLGQQKFGDTALSMLFTEAGYEQATRAAVAQLHAQRMQEAGLKSVADLGCGIGADSLAFAQAGLEVLAVELDKETAAFTAYNLREFTGSQVLVGNVENMVVEELTDSAGKPLQALWLDPARRTVDGGHTTSRIFDPEAFSPPLSFIKKLAATGIPMGVKMGPGIPHEEIPANCEAQWVSHGSQVVEVVLWFNALARKGIRRSATLLSANPRSPEILSELFSETGDSDELPASTGEIETYLYEPDGAVIRAHLVGKLAAQLEAHLIDERIAYLSSTQLVHSPAASAYEVLGEMSLNDKVLKKWVREENIGALTIKKRGVDIVPEQLRKKLLGQGKKKKGTVEATLIITRIGEGTHSRRVAIHARAINSSSDR